VKPLVHSLLVWLALPWCSIFLGYSVRAAEEEALQALVARVRPSVVTVRVQGRDGDQLGIGTGFVIDPQGLIATNFHVIQEGRPFTVETSSGRKPPVLAVEASDRNGDLAIIRVDVGDQPLPALPLAPALPAQGSPVLAFGNPLGLKDSVVDGIVSALREVQGQELIQVAMPIEPGNSGGPLVDRQGRVLGIINMKSAVENNLGFAIPIQRIEPLREHPNSVTIDRWVLLGRLDNERWTVVGGALWQQIGGTLTVRGLGNGFGGRSLCLSTQPVPEPPFDLSVMVRLDDESGAAGLAFHSDGTDRHYGFYPSNGQLRLTRFDGPSVYSWDVLHAVASEHYLTQQWNQLRVRVDADRLTCYVNGEKVIESTDLQLTSGQAGLVKFRATEPQFRAFRIDTEALPETLSPGVENWIAQLDDGQLLVEAVAEDQVRELRQDASVAARELERRAVAREREAEQLRRLASDVRLAPVLESLSDLSQYPAEERLLRGALSIARLDDLDLDIDFYLQRVDAMAAEIRESLQVDADERDRRSALDRYLFQENGFRGGRSEYYHPANSHLNRVLDDREGLPITLSILYIELGRRLDLQITGIGLPGHFMVQWDTPAGDQQLIDVFEGGEDVSLEEAEAMAFRFAGRPLRESDLRPQSTTAILLRVLNNLMGIAANGREPEAMLRYAEALVRLAPDAPDYRMMRAQLRGMTDRKNRAIEDLDWLLGAEQSGFTEERLLQMRKLMLPQR